MSNPNIHRKPSKGLRHRLMLRWEDEIFPAFLLVFGQPPFADPLADWDEKRDAWDARRRYHDKVTRFYHRVYLKEYNLGGVTGDHTHRCANEFISWAREQRSED